MRITTKIKDPKSQMIRIILIIFFIYTSIALSQLVDTFKIPRDTTYSLMSALNKYKTDYPFIKPIRFEELNSNLYRKDIPYTSYGERILLLDIFSKKEKETLKKPAVLMLHGGGWSSGDRSLMYPLANYLSIHGYIAITVEYRLSPEALYPAAVDDINSSLLWIRNNAGEYGINLNQITILGCSAGAQLAGLIGLKYGTYLDSKEKIHKQINAIVNIDGVMDFTSEEVRKYEDDPTRETTAAGRWFGGNFMEKTRLWKEASPIFYVSENSRPIQFINSSMPRFHYGREQIIKNHKNNTIYYEIKTFDDAPHSFWLFDPWFEKTGVFIVEFLDKIFKTKGQK